MPHAARIIPATYTRSAMMKQISDISRESHHSDKTPDLIVHPEGLDRADYSMIGLHGRDADKHAFFPFVRQMGFLHTRWILPSAPHPTAPGAATFRWFHDAAGEPDRIETGRMLISGIIETEIGRGVVPENIFLVGFSQGAMMALDTALRYHTRLGGVVSLSGMLAAPELLESERHSANAHVPVFMGHGRHDRIIAVETGRAAARRLSVMGYDVEWREYDTGHRISSQEVKDIRAFLHMHMYGFPMNDPREAAARLAPF